MNIDNSYSSNHHGDPMLYLVITHIGILQQRNNIFHHFPPLKESSSSDALSHILKCVPVFSFFWRGRNKILRAIHLLFFFTFLLLFFICLSTHTGLRMNKSLLLYTDYFLFVHGLIKSLLQTEKICHHYYFLDLLLLFYY